MYTYLHMGNIASLVWKNLSKQSERRQLTCIKMLASFNDRKKKEYILDFSH